MMPTYRAMVKKNEKDPIFGFLVKKTVSTRDFDYLDLAIEWADEWFEEGAGETVTVSELRENKAPVSKYMRALWAEGEGH